MKQGFSWPAFFFGFFWMLVKAALGLRRTLVSGLRELVGDRPRDFCVGQVAIPDTPAGRVLSAFLAAFNSADPARIRAFDESHRSKPFPLEQTLGFCDVTGGFTLLRIEKSEPLSIVALLQENHWDTIGRIELSVNSEDPPKIVSDRLIAVPCPPEFAIPRLTEADALVALSERAEQLARDDRFSGAVVVAHHGKVLLQKAWGRANREAGSPITLDTQFRIGSMNKMFTATATLQLIQEGKLALDDPIGKYLLEYPNNELAAKVTVRHLLTHTGGTGDIFGSEFTKNRLALREHRDYLNLYGARALTHEPGAEQRYSNYGYVLLGALIAQVSSMSYDDYVRNNVFRPAGMTSTDALPETDDVPNRVRGYMRRDGAWLSNADTLPWRGTAAGGGYSTARDLFQFAEALKSGKLISKAMLAEAAQPQVQQYGYGFEVVGEGSLRRYGHSGGAPGINGEVRVYPVLGYALVGLSNLDPPAATRVVQFFALRMPTTP